MRRLNNKGMSLVEVLVAMTILCIVIIPVFRIMTNVAYNKQKALLQEEADECMSNVMEGMLSYSTSVLDSIFSNPDETMRGKGMVLNGNGFFASYIPVKFYPVSNSLVGDKIFDINGKYSYDFSVENVKKYYIRNLIGKYGNEYDFDIEISPSLYESITKFNEINLSRDSNMEILDSSEAYDIDVNLLKKNMIKKINDNKDDFLLFLTDENNGGCIDPLMEDGSSMLLWIENNGIDENIIPYDKVHIKDKRIIVDIYNADNKDIVEVAVDYAFCIDGINYYKDEGELKKYTLNTYSNLSSGETLYATDDITETLPFPYTVTYKNQYSIYSYQKNTFVKGALQRVFLSYIPKYEADGDEIIINNNLDREVEFYLFKELDLKENKWIYNYRIRNYKCRVIENKSGGNGVKLYHNLFTNFNDVNEYGNINIASNIDAKPIIQIIDNDRNFKLEYSDQFVSDSNLFNYKVNVKMYKSGDNKVLMEENAVRNQEKRPIGVIF